MKAHTMTRQDQIRAAFWDSHIIFQQRYSRHLRQNQYGTDIRQAFVNFVDSLARSGEISEALASRVTL
jgi:hypothetical protein